MPSRTVRSIGLGLVVLLGACDRPVPGPVPTTPVPTAVPTATDPGIPDARDADIGSLLRPGAEERAVVYGEMNGVGPEEIVVLSATPPSDPQLPGTPYVDAFAWDPGGDRWATVFDATAYGDPSSGRGPVLGAGDAVAQDVPALQLLDLTEDGAAELVVAVQTYGATEGPLDLWILSWGPDAFVTRFTRSTERGGRVSFGAGTVTLETGVYRPGDPGCCPSAIERLVIGWDAEAGRIAILERTEEEVPQY